MRKPLIALATAILLAPFAARGAAPADVLIVNLKSQQSVHFALAVSPVLSFKGDQLSIIPDESAGEVNYPLSEIHDICFRESSAIDLPKADVTFTINDNIVTVDGLKTGVKTSVIDTAGRIVMSATADAAGCAVIDLRPLPTGIYIICADTITYKYIKRP